MVQSALESVPKATLSIWPYYVVPPLASWSSSSPPPCVILRDAPPAIPPTAGQGASQAFEDTYSLAALLANVSLETSLDTNLALWEEYRKRRIDRVIKLTLKLNNTRLPKEERATLPKGQIWTSENVEDRAELDWLYNHHVEEELARWIGGNQGENRTNATVNGNKH